MSILVRIGRVFICYDKIILDYFFLGQGVFCEHTIQVKRASAVLILADRCADNEDGEDAANIMRATAIKNFREDARIIIQLLQYRNKVGSRPQHISHVINTGL